MKQIKAIIQPFMLDAVIDALRQQPDLPGVTVSEVVGFGRQRASDTPAGQRRTIGRFGYARKIKLEIVVPDGQADTVRELICQHARTGKPGDGLVIVESVERVVRIRDAL